MTDDSLLLNGFALTLIVLVLKALFLGMATAAKRGQRKQFLNEEDAKWLGGEHLPIDPEAVSRIGRAHRNDLENLLLFAIAGSIYFVLRGSPMVGIGYCAAFLIARIGHTIAYLGKRPALRRNAYTLGFLVIAALAIHSALIVADVV